MIETDQDPYAPPHTKIPETPPAFSYVGFWARLFAALTDTVLLVLVFIFGVFPVLNLIYGVNFAGGTALVMGPLNWLVVGISPAVATVLFWIFLSATPGKMLVEAKIVDADTGEDASPSQLIGRYIAYLLSLLPLGLGFFWIALDRRKQGWHDKLANTLVVHPNTQLDKGAGSITDTLNQ